MVRDRTRVGSKGRPTPEVVHVAPLSELLSRDLSALEDQSIAGVIMWVPGSLAFLLPMLWLIVTTIAASAPGRVGAAPLPDIEKVR